MISVQTEDFDLAEQYQILRSDHPAGAIVTFCGLVRDLDNNDKIDFIELEHYPAMTTKSLRSILDQAQSRWQVHQCRVIHRIGKLKANDQIVFVGVSSAHRADAFEACQFIMDFLKTQAPFWKKQSGATGTYWVEAKTTDQNAANRWDNQFK